MGQDPPATVPAERRCTKCSAPLTEVGGAELCPGCLLERGLGEPPTEAVGQKIGRYKVMEQVGEGGCGVVYVAEQPEPVRRRVALKVIKVGMDTKAVVARFEAERQALALMDHPNIARVLDAGTTGAASSEISGFESQISHPPAPAE